MSSTQTSRNGTWPRSLTWATVRVKSLSLHHLLFFFFLSLWSNVYLFFNIKKNCFLRFCFSFYDLALLLFGTCLQCFATLKSSTQTSRNGTWPRSFPCKAVRVNSLSSTPLSTTCFSFFFLSPCSKFHLFFNIQKNCF